MSAPCELTFINYPIRDEEIQQRSGFFSLLRATIDQIRASKNSRPLSTRTQLANKTNKKFSSWSKKRVQNGNAAA